MNDFKIYYPYISDKPNKKLYIITNENKRVYFGAAGYEHYTEGHLDVKRRDQYLQRHQKNENWNDYMSSGSLAYHLLWTEKSMAKAYNKYLAKFNLKKY